ncbi:cupin domain-containing protein [Paraglaciecola chathamensis]|uniref:Cupin domain-containing protein n=1 Tax=Paraglaciecola chathamensis TaxID=368405 RepID=A0ABS0WDG5_9ALTE|nr:cupin domain-containing protein [Paraglaciecola chathamensis]MBJ2136512.1 cupin domain-containing protein [Paraglaciecola chathamensis]
MNTNADFSQRVVVHSQQQPWVASPMPGVDRRPLDRVGDEVARATTIVRYAPGSEFSPHVHTGGEEFIVLDGVFQDQHGDFPAGSYVRNPPQSSHKPGSDEGCIIFVKLWQFNPDDRQHVNVPARVDSTLVSNEFTPPAIGNVCKELYRDEFEVVSVYELAPHSVLELGSAKGLEALVLDGEFHERSDTLEKHSWLRLPIGSSLHGRAGKKGARMWIKTEHLPFVDEQIARVKNT